MSLLLLNPRRIQLLASLFIAGVSASAAELPLRGLAHVALRVGDLPRARAFYTGVGGFEEAFDVKNPDGSVAEAYFKINDDQFLEILPGLAPDEVVPMAGIAIRTDQLESLRARLADLGLNPSAIRPDPDGSLGFTLTSLPGQNLGYLEFVQYGPGSLAERTRGQFLGPRRLSRHLEHTGIIASNFDEAYAFYTQVLGFKEAWRRLQADRGRVMIDHIMMPGGSGDFLELSNLSGAQATLNRKRAGTAAHFALTVPDIEAAARDARARDATLRFTPPNYGLDNRWNFNIFDPNGTRMEFMQSADPKNPPPAVVFKRAAPVAAPANPASAQ